MNAVHFQRILFKKIVNIKFCCIFLNGNRCYTTNPVLEIDDSYYESFELKNSINRRNMEVNLTEIQKLSESYKILTDNKTHIESLRAKISAEIFQLQNKNDSQVKLNSLITTAKILRNDIKVVKSMLSNIEKDLLPLSLKLPNDLDEHTSDSETEIFVSSLASKNTSEHHLKIGKDLNVVEFMSPTKYYFKESAAIFEIEVLSYFIRKLTSNSFLLFSNPDFSRSSITDVCGETEGKTLMSLGKCSGENDILYLNGGASHLPFLSFLFQTVVNNTDLPLLFVTQGRNYWPTLTEQEDLYSVYQSSAIQIFIVTSNQNNSTEFEHIISLITSIYNDLDIPFRIVYGSARSLLPAESLRANFQLYSSYHQKYMNAGYVSKYTNYFSKRNNMFYSDGKNIAHTNIISGTIVKMPSLLASHLEYTQNCELPKCVLNSLKVT